MYFYKCAGDRLFKVNMRARLCAWTIKKAAVGVLRKVLTREF